MQQPEVRGSALVLRSHLGSSVSDDCKHLPKVGILSTDESGHCFSELGRLNVPAVIMSAGENVSCGLMIMHHRCTCGHELICVITCFESW